MARPFIAWRASASRLAAPPSCPPAPLEQRARPSYARRRRLPRRDRRRAWCPPCAEGTGARPSFAPASHSTPTPSIVVRPRRDVARRVSATPRDAASRLCLTRRGRRARANSTGRRAPRATPSRTRAGRHAARLAARVRVQLDGRTRPRRQPRRRRRAPSAARAGPGEPRRLRRRCAIDAPRAARRDRAREQRTGVATARCAPRRSDARAAGHAPIRPLATPVAATRLRRGGAGTRRRRCARGAAERALSLASSRAPHPLQTARGNRRRRRPLAQSRERQRARHALGRHAAFPEPVVSLSAARARARTNRRPSAPPRRRRPIRARRRGGDPVPDRAMTGRARIFTPRAPMGASTPWGERALRGRGGVEALGRSRPRRSAEARTPTRASRPPCLEAEVPASGAGAAPSSVATRSRERGDEARRAVRGTKAARGGGVARASSATTSRHVLPRGESGVTRVFVRQVDGRVRGGAAPSRPRTVPERERARPDAKSTTPRAGAERPPPPRASNAAAAA